MKLSDPSGDSYWEQGTSRDTGDRCDIRRLGCSKMGCMQVMASIDDLVGTWCAPDITACEWFVMDYLLYQTRDYASRKLDYKLYQEFPSAFAQQYVPASRNSLVNDLVQ